MTNDIETLTWTGISEYPRQRRVAANAQVAAAVLIDQRLQRLAHVVTHAASARDS